MTKPVVTQKTNGCQMKYMGIFLQLVYGSSSGFQPFLFSKYPPNMAQFCLVTREKKQYPYCQGIMKRERKQDSMQSAPPKWYDREEIGITYRFHITLQSTRLERDKIFRDKEKNKHSFMRCSAVLFVFFPCLVKVVASICIIAIWLYL